MQIFVHPTPSTAAGVPDISDAWVQLIPVSTAALTRAEQLAETLTQQGCRVVVTRPLMDGTDLGTSATVVHV
jgi:hypothetical protein